MARRTGSAAPLHGGRVPPSLAQRMGPPLAPSYTSRGDRYALSALKKKRATLASEMVQLERQLRHRREALGHVDATLRLLDPTVEIDAIPKEAPEEQEKVVKGKFKK